MILFLQLVSELSVEDLGELVGLTVGAGELNILVLHVIFLNLQVYVWKLLGVAGNAWNGLIPAIALQLAAVAYGINSFS